MHAIIEEIMLAMALSIELAAGLLVGLAAIQATVRALTTFLGKSPPMTLEHVRLRFGRWLTVALELELGADIVRTAVTPSWNDIGQLAAIVVIRTVLNYFLEKDIASANSREAAA